MPLQYQPAFNINEKDATFRYLNFSKNGEFLAVVAHDHIVVWDTLHGRKFKTIIQVQSPLCVLWIDEYTFLVGLDDGRLGQFKACPEGEVRITNIYLDIGVSFRFGRHYPSPLLKQVQVGFLLSLTQSMASC